MPQLTKHKGGACHLQGLGKMGKWQIINQVNIVCCQRRDWCLPVLNPCMHFGQPARMLASPCFKKGSAWKCSHGGALP